MLIKRRDGQAAKQRLSSLYQDHSPGGALDRRGFLRQAGLGGAGLAALGTGLAPGRTRAAEKMAIIDHGRPVKRVKNVCTHCSVGCTVIAEVQDDVWVGQEPAYESPINQGTHCAKGASVRELVHGERRLKYPLKLEGGEWKRLSWDQALDEIAAKMLDIRQRHTPEAVYWLGSAKFTNEAAYLFRKMGAYWGTNTVDHQARICHSTTVAGVANTWGYGAQTNSYNDIRNARTMIIIGGNPAESHPIGMQHVLAARDANRANMFVVDPRFTRTAAHATEHVRIRPGTDIPVIWGMLWHIFQNGWEDKEFIQQRVYGMDEVRAEVAKWHPQEVERVTGLPEGQVKLIAQLRDAEARHPDLVHGRDAEDGGHGQRPRLLHPAAGHRQRRQARAPAPTSSAATPTCRARPTSASISRPCPATTGLDEAAWRHWGRVWDVDYEWLRAASPPRS
jgi:formate dehydrogenase major subunit